MRLTPLRALGVAGLLALAYLLGRPPGIDPAAWDPPAPSERPDPSGAGAGLSDAERIAGDLALGPEDLAFDRRGNLFASHADGRVIRCPASGGPAEVYARTDGRPLGLAIDGEDRLLVADALRGLLAVSADGKVTVLASEEGGRPFRFTNGVAVGPSGAVYFTDASWQRGPTEFYEEMLEHRPHGRLLRFEPATGTVTRLLDGLYFANGVAVGPGEAYLLVVETFAYRVTRYWLDGPRAGQAETFIDNLPGFPDGISYNGQGIFWLALFAPRSALLDALMPWPSVRGLLAHVPAALLPGPVRYAHVVGLDEDGLVIHDLRDPEGRYAPISSVRQHGGWLYLGSLTAHGIGRVAVPRGRTGPES
jgi:sugar lactone lactonase YvrE